MTASLFQCPITVVWLGLIIVTLVSFTVVPNTASVPVSPYGSWHWR